MRILLVKTFPGKAAAENITPLAVMLTLSFLFSTTTSKCHIIELLTSKVLECFHKFMLVPNRINFDIQAYALINCFPSVVDTEIPLLIVVHGMLVYC